MRIDQGLYGYIISHVDFHDRLEVLLLFFLSFDDVVQLSKLFDDPLFLLVFVLGSHHELLELILPNFFVVGIESILSKRIIDLPTGLRRLYTYAILTSRTFLAME
jgi:hypothetical protein